MAQLNYLMGAPGGVEPLIVTTNPAEVPNLVIVGIQTDTTPVLPRHVRAARSALNLP